MIHFGIVDLAAFPLRREPTDKAEMTSQLLFGDIFQVLELHQSWGFIKNFFDDYTGWTDLKHIREIDKTEYNNLQDSIVYINRGLYSDTVSWNGQKILIPAGSSLYDLENNTAHMAGRDYIFEGLASPFSFDNMAELLTTAGRYLSCPYLWGGKTCMGLDCSGFTQVVYKQHGIRMFRDSSQQAGQGELVNFLSESRPGDLAFFDDEEGNIIHVGILIDQQQIIHCSGKVRIDMIDHHGIFDRERKKYTHNLRLIRRLV